jgi:glycosyltransferase involved in cell wall biosynthesis
MKIVIIGARGFPSYYGGFETAVRNLAPYFADQGHEVVVYSREMNNEPKILGIRVVRTPGIDRKSLSTLTFGLTATLHAVIFERPNVALVLNVANGYWLPILKLSKVPTVVNVDGIEWERDKWSSLGKAVFKIGAMFTSKFATTLISDSEEIKRIWLREFKRDSQYIPYGGLLTDPKPLQGLASKIKGPYLLYVARLVPENSFDLLLSVARDLASDLQIVIVGSDAYGGDANEKVASLADASFGRVVWLGHIGDEDLLNSLLANCQVYFHGHTVGGTNPILVQAMASSAAIVAVDTKFNREVLGNAGIITRPDKDQIVDHVRALIQNDQKIDFLRHSSRKRFQHKFTWEKVNKRYLDVLLSNQKSRDK